MNTLDQIEVDITVELGAAIMPIHHLLRMGRGAIIELDTHRERPARDLRQQHPGRQRRDQGRRRPAVRSKSPRRCSKSADPADFRRAI